MKTRAKPEEPDEVEHHCFVIKVIQRKSGNWYVTLCKDAIRIWESPAYNTKNDALNSILRNVV